MIRSLLLVFALTSTLALCDAAEPRQIASVEGITEYEFENGLRVLLFPDGSRSKVTVNLTVLVGSRNEGYGETGMAHLLEHMVFKGTPRHPKVPKELQEHGAQFNGTTSSDRVNYFETLAATDEHLEFAIGLEADRLVNSFIKAEDLESEMTVVRNEFERGENSPGAVLGKRVAGAAYDWHNYGKPTIGNRSDIERVPVENLRAFYKKFYQPDNVVLIIAGRFEPARALELVQKHFGPIPRPTRKLTATYTEEPPQDGERMVTLRRVGDIAGVAVAYHIPAGPHPDMAAVQVLANILSTQPSGRFHKALVLPKKAVSASAFARAQHDPGLMMLDADVAREASLEEARDLLISTAERVGSEGVTAEEVTRAKQQILKARELAANDTAQLGIALSDWAAQGDWRLYFLHRDRIEQVNPEQVKAAAARYLKRNNRTVGLFIPAEKPERIVVPSTPELGTLFAGYKGRAAIAEGEPFDATPETIEARAQRSELPEGIKVTLLPKKNRGQEVHLLLTLRYGNEDNLKGYEAAAALLPELMLRGTQKLNYQQIRDELDRLKATLSAGAGGGGGRRGGRGRGGAPTASAGSITFSIQATRDSLPEVLEILRQVLREPTLPESHFDLIRRERLAALEQMRTEPAALSPRLLQQLLNPHPAEDIRYVPSVNESAERLRAVTREQLVQLHHDFLGAQAGELSIVGDFDSQTCLPILKQTFAGWKAPKPYARIPQPLVQPLTNGLQRINTPDKANATYTAGFSFPLQDIDPDYPALLMANYILGSGTLSSRLGNRIRQKDGLSYGVTSSLSTSAQEPRAVLTITAICNPQNMDRLAIDVQEELDRLVRDGVTGEELEQARKGYLQSLKVGRSNDASLAAALNSLRYLGRTFEYEAGLERKLQALTADQVASALRRHVDSKRLVIVAAGDFETSVAGTAQTP